MLSKKSDYVFVTQEQLKHIAIKGKPYPARGAKLTMEGEDVAFLWEAIKERKACGSPACGSSGKDVIQVVQPDIGETTYMGKTTNKLLWLDPEKSKKLNGNYTFLNINGKTDWETPWYKRLEDASNEQSRINTEAYNTYIEKTNLIDANLKKALTELEQTYKGIVQTIEGDYATEIGQEGTRHQLAMENISKKWDDLLKSKQEELEAAKKRKDEEKIKELEKEIEKIPDEKAKELEKEDGTNENNLNEAYNSKELKLSEGYEKYNSDVDEKTNSANKEKATLLDAYNSTCKKADDDYLKVLEECRNGSCSEMGVDANGLSNGRISYDKALDEVKIPRSCAQEVMNRRIRAIPLATVINRVFADLEHFMSFYVVKNSHIYNSELGYATYEQNGKYSYESGMYKYSYPTFSFGVVTQNFYFSSLTYYAKYKYNNSGTVIKKSAEGQISSRTYMIHYGSSREIEERNIITQIDAFVVQHAEGYGSGDITLDKKVMTKIVLKKKDIPRPVVEAYDKLDDKYEEDLEKINASEKKDLDDLYENYLKDQDYLTKTYENSVKTKNKEFDVQVVAAQEKYVSTASSGYETVNAQVLTIEHDGTKTSDKKAKEIENLLETFTRGKIWPAEDTLLRELNKIDYDREQALLKLKGDYDDAKEDLEDEYEYAKDAITEKYKPQKTELAQKLSEDKEDAYNEIKGKQDDIRDAAYEKLDTLWEDKYAAKSKAISDKYDADCEAASKIEDDKARAKAYAEAYNKKTSDNGSLNCDYQKDRFGIYKSAGSAISAQDIVASQSARQIFEGSYGILDCGSGYKVYTSWTDTYCAGYIVHLNPATLTGADFAKYYAELKEQSKS